MGGLRPFSFCAASLFLGVLLFLLFSSCLLFSSVFGRYNVYLCWDGGGGR